VRPQIELVTASCDEFGGLPNCAKAPVGRPALGPVACSMEPQTSPAALVCGAGLPKSHSTIRLPLTSSQARVSWFVERRAGLLSV
jgi:hypothetical protein